MVSLEGTPLVCFTNSEGRFGIQTVRPGSYRLVVVYAGFRSQEVRVRVPGDDAIEHTLDMKKAPRSGVAVADSLPPFNLSLSVRGAN